MMGGLGLLWRNMGVYMTIKFWMIKNIRAVVDLNKWSGLLRFQDSKRRVRDISE